MKEYIFSCPGVLKPQELELDHELLPVSVAVVDVPQANVLIDVHGSFAGQLIWNVCVVVEVDSASSNI